MNILKRNLPIFLTGLALLIVFAIIIAFSQVQNQENPGLTTVEGAELVAAHTYILGEPGAAFSLVVFTDYTSLEDAIYQETLQQLYGRNTRYLNIAFRHFPTTEEAFSVSKAAQIAGEQGKFWEYSAELYKRTLQEEQKSWSEGILVNLADQLGMNTKEFQEDLTKEGFDSIVKTDVKHGELLGVKDTPTFFLNNDKLEISTPEELYQKVQEEIDGVKETAKKREQANSPSSQENNNTNNQTEEKEGKILIQDQIDKLKQTKQISFTEEGWFPKDTVVVKGQTVEWTNNSEREITIIQLDRHYSEFRNGKVIKPGESFTLKFTLPGYWRYREKESKKGAKIFVEDHYYED